MRIPRLLLIKSEISSDERNSEANSLPAGYALLDSDRNYSLISLLKPTILIADSDQVNSAPNSKFEMVEVWEDTPVTLRVAAKWHLKPKRLYVMEFNRDFVQQLFPEDSNIEFVTKFRIKEKPERSVLNADKLIEKLLMSGATISYRHPEGGNLVHFATEKRSARLIAALHKYGADFNVQRKTGVMPLHIAVMKKDLETVKILLENGAYVDGKTTYGSTALHLATRAQLFDIVQFLVDKSANVSVKTATGWTPLHIAADVGDYNMASLFLKSGSSIDAVIDSDGFVAGATPLHIALKKSHLTVAKMLVDHGASLNAQCVKGRNALYFSVDAGSLELVEYLLKRHLDVNEPGNKKAFRHAFFQRNNFSSCQAEIIKILIEYGFSLDASDATVPDVLFGAIYNNFFELVEKLLDYAADVHQTHIFLGYETTPLHAACRYADKNLVQLLLDRGADPIARRGVEALKTPIADAVEVETVKLLVAKKIPVHNRPDFLRSAVAYKRFKLTELLLEHGCDPNSTPLFNEKLPLTMAVLRTDLPTIEILMQYGARFDFGNILSLTREGYTCDTKPSDFLEALLVYGFSDLDALDVAKITEFFNESNNNDEDYVGSCIFSHLMLSHLIRMLVNCLLKTEFEETLAQHLIKLEVAGKKVGKENAGALIPIELSSTLDLSELRRNCEKELRSMKAEKVCHITMYDLLTKNVARVARYLRNDSIRRVLDDFNYEKMYPLYGNIIKCRIRQGNWRRQFLPQGFKAFCLLVCRLPRLPHEVKEDIVGLLDNHDFVSLQKCIQPT